VKWRFSPTGKRLVQARLSGTTTLGQHFLGWMHAVLQVVQCGSRLHQAID
jgi:hypothetical protein